MILHPRTALTGMLPYLVACHILIITLSNYLVQIPVDIAGFHSTWGTFTFPLIFLATDLTVRFLGAKTARAVIFFVMFPALLVSYVISVIFFNGQYLGFSELANFNVLVFRIALASFIAYVVGQLLDVIVFNRLRNTLHWWLAPTASTTLGSLVDTFVFFSIAFYASSDAFMATHWIEIAWVDYTFKLLISLFFFIPAYGMILTRLMRQSPG